MDDEPPPLCLYCGINISSKRWTSDWHDDKRYEFLSCDCGKKNWRAVIDGSGHEIKLGKLESILRVVCDTSCNK